MTDEYLEFPEDEAEPAAVDVDERDGIPWGGVIGTLGVILIVIFAVQNTEDVQVEFLWMSGSYPLAIVILVTAVAAGLVVLIGGAFLRRRRRRRRAERDELRQLRSDD